MERRPALAGPLPVDRALRAMAFMWMTSPPASSVVIGHGRQGRCAPGGTTNGTTGENPPTPRLDQMQIVTAAEAVAGIASGQQVFVHGGAATPTPLLEALVARAGELRDVGLIHFHTQG